MKKNKKISLQLVTAFSILSTTQIFAVCSLPTGWYVGGNIGLTKFYGKSYSGSSSTKTRGTSWNPYGGYKFTPFFALEAGYTQYAKTRIKNSQGTTAASDKHHSYDVTSKWILAIPNTGIELFGKVGVAWITSKIGSVDATAAAVNSMTFDTSNNTAVGLYWGAGVQYYFSPNIAGAIQYAEARGNSRTGNLGLASAGLSLLF